MPKNFKRGRTVYLWYKRIFTIGGIWPLEETFLKFYVGALYFGCVSALTIADFVNVCGDFSQIIANLLESSSQTLTACKMIAIRHSTVLRGIVKQFHSALTEDMYMDQTEKELYLSYNDKGRLFLITASCFSWATIILYYVKPIEGIVRAVLQNETIPFVLPSRARLFYEITDSPTYAFAYLSLAPVLYYYHINGLASCFIGSLTAHVAGDLAILAHRIRKINSSDLSNDYRQPDIAFRHIVIKHNEIIETATSLANIFNYVLLVELLLMTGLMGLICYNILVVSLTVSLTDFFFLISYIMVILLLILYYCIIGEYLIHESMNVHAAYYECYWYNMSPNYRKYLIICMGRAQQPLKLTAGRLYIFSLPQFTDILKTSMAYISMLRNLV